LIQLVGCRHLEQCKPADLWQPKGHRYHLPIEAVCLSIAVTYGTVIVYEIFRGAAVVGENDRAGADGVGATLDVRKMA
jgi:hypothetical protein